MYIFPKYSLLFGTKWLLCEFRNYWFLFSHTYLFNLCYCFFWSAQVANNNFSFLSSLPTCKPLSKRLSLAVRLETFRPSTSRRAERREYRSSLVQSTEPRTQSFRQNVCPTLPQRCWRSSSELSSSPTLQPARYRSGSIGHRRRDSRRVSCPCSSRRRRWRS